MNFQHRYQTARGVALSLVMFTSLSAAALAQHVTVDGVVTGRSGPSMTMKTADAPRLTVLLSDSTKATEKGGFLGMGGKDLGIASLVPGLAIKVEGDYNPDHQLVAKKITFSRGSMKTAKQIEAGLNPVNEQVAKAQDQLMSDRKDINQSQSDIAKNSQDIDATRQGLDATNQATAGNTTAIGKANSRFGTLDQYVTKGSITVNFANGKSTVSPKDKEQLTEFVKSAADTPGYMIEVQGYASTSGPAALNQRLSADRAAAVLAIIQQTGVVPMTRILAPAAMGTTNQLSTDKGKSAQAQNRRVVVTIVVNKGITG
jgi:outer membrane protein OmpA-like peptidoglycan-associated protein